MQTCAFLQVGRNSPHLELHYFFNSFLKLKFYYSDVILGHYNAQGFLVESSLIKKP